MELVEHHDVAYATLPNRFHTFDIYIPACLHHPSTLVCFIHGGAWRAEDKADHVDLARNLAVSTGHPVALANYRLTPREPTPDNALHHPAHAIDVLQFLEFILSWHEENGGCLPRKPSKLFLMGHSCSAHMLCTIFLHMPGHSDSVCPSEELVRSTAAIVMSEGIYDIDALLLSFPGYRTQFIENTFGRRDSFGDVSASNAAMRPGSQHIHWFIIHSSGDTLVDERQSADMYAFLGGKSCLVSKSFGDLEDDHDLILKSPKYIDMVNRYFKGVVAV